MSYRGDTQLRIPTRDKLKFYLASLHVKGLGPKTIDRLIASFSPAPLIAALDTDPTPVLAVKGFGGRTGAPPWSMLGPPTNQHAGSAGRSTG
jgi:hypothetical protein